MPFGRIITAMITPFKEDGEINYEKAAELADFLSENGSDAIVLAGTTGESPTLSDDEKLNLFSRIKKTIGGKIKIIAGTGSNSTEHSIFLTKEAEKCGVDGIMLVVPYYNKPSQEGLYRHFAAIAESTELPVMLYNIPGRSAVNMTAETTLRLAQIPNIRAVKEASGNLEQIAAICSGAPEGFAVYSGDDSMTLPIMSIGGSGVVSVASHIAGREIKQMVLEFQSGNYREALRIHHRLLPLFKVLFITSNPSPVKGALKLLGNDTGPLRLPLVELTEDEQAAVRKVLQNLNYL
ncbi:MAG TPA: 4-hydroxy-tetrahydrodipicolinate synthase [Firmicutes bacterium]|nr:4-hydroxy-tetrahydrodipicolinate synthase [Bacillota bacterium]